ncbi:tetratricopeptide repeat protein 34-like [Clytia hemisphaerica]|uniref:Uncharacterized protein n=1 Tax=Clytia hemisphaerica TaxID=252671 RepID=A0A7M5V7Y6_9CNID|eukprot:TCONS_00015711-protein
MSTIVVSPQGLLVNTSFDGESSEERETTATMLLLMNAIAECKNKNIKKASVEFNESYSATYSNDDLFTSKLLELSFQDLEILYQSLCADMKNRRSSKQHEKKGSFKKKSSVSDSSFANAAYEGEMRSSSSSSSSLGRKRSQISLNEESILGKACLRKAYLLYRDLQKPEYQNTQSEAFLNIAQIHLKVENFHSCAILCVEFLEKFTVERFLCQLDDVQIGKIADICLFIAAKESGGVDIDAKIQYSKMAARLQPNNPDPVLSLCNLYRYNNETEKAFATCKVYLDEVDANCESMIVTQMICLTDSSKHALVISHLEDFLSHHHNCTELSMILCIAHILNRDPEKGMLLLDQLGLQDDTDKKKQFASLLELLKVFNLKLFVNELCTYLSVIDESVENLQMKKTVLSLAARLLAYKSENRLEIAKLYIDSLHVCEELDIAQDFLIKLVKEYPTETLPMVYLANIRLKVGAYVASTEDFRALLKVYGEENLTNDLSKLPLDERKEIARVHRLHGVRFLGNEYAFREASECFTVVLCAIDGSSAPGLFLSRGYCYMHLNNFEAADQDFKQCLERKEFVTAALCARAVLYAVTTHVEEALRDFKEAFNLDSTACQKCLPKLPYEHVTVFSQMVIQYIKQGVENTSAGRKKLYDISDLNVVDISTANTATTEMDLDILRYSEFLCKVFPSNIDYVSTYIECLHLSNDKITMKIAIDRALGAFPGEPRFEVWRGVALSEQRQLEDSINSMKDLCDLNEETLHILTYISPKAKKQIYERCMKKGRKSIEKERYGSAVAYYSLASSLFKNDVCPLRERMQCHQRLAHHKKWLIDMSRILALDPTTNDYCIRAVYHQKQGEDLMACEDYMSALDLDEQETIQMVTVNANTEDVTRLFHITAVSISQIGKVKTASRLCEAGLKFDPNHKGLKQLVEKTSNNRCTLM